MEAEIVKDTTPVQGKQEALPPAKQSARLEKWSYYMGYHGPELSGLVYDHPRFADGDFIYTSRVIMINKEIGIAETRNTVYILVGKEQEHPAQLS